MTLFLSTDLDGHPRRMGPLKAGVYVEVKIQGVGVLANRVVDGISKACPAAIPLRISGYCLT